MNSKFAKVPEKPSFPDEEEKVLKYWEEIDAFKQQLELNKDKPQYSFYDGPPFATGLPHYGHIAAGTIKDVVTRYATMKGHHVERRFGWDCHGLPIEYEIDKTHNITSSLQREQMGVKAYNQLCRDIVMKYSKEWRTVVSRYGRWIDFDNDYKTMDTKFMESVWWTFKQIYDKGLVYRGSKIMPFSTGCNTVLSNFEAGSNYKDAKDPAVIVTFPMIDDPSTSFIAWTTTPWTLPSNLALAVHPEFVYVKIIDEDKQKQYICAETRLKDVLKQANIQKHKVLEKFKGQELENKKYTPLFTYFYDQFSPRNCFSVQCANWVTSDTGTGIVHCAPGFGDDDYQTCLSKGLVENGKAPCPIDFDGKFTSEVTDFAGIYIKDADQKIKDTLKANGRLVSSGTIIHSYPYCWRSQTPLIYRTFDCWFIKVTDIKQDLIANNLKAKWVPPHIQEKRFHNWLVDARDWCFSRNRFWGNPIPLWVSDDMEEVVCIGSIAELKERSGYEGEITDIHREVVDTITIPSQQGKGTLKRIPEVFDCWFESGSMPFAQVHYPFSISEEEFQKRYPADFIAEGIDQTRGWFYTLNVIATAVKGLNPYKNLIVNGIVLAEDGTKMSKSLKNYPDPMMVFQSLGADATRLYLCNSPVVRADDLRFCEAGVFDIVKQVFLPWFNSYRFLIQNITRWEKSHKPFIFDEKLKDKICADPNGNIMDKWIIAANQNLIKFVRHEMDNYRLYNVVKHMLDFLHQLSNWYVRLNRSRMKGEDGDEEAYICLNTLFDVLFQTTTMMSCITPFLTEYIYQNMKQGLDDNSEFKKQSIHFLEMPKYEEELLNERIESIVKKMQSVIMIGRKIRDNNNLSIKTPLSKCIIVESDKEIANDFMLVQSYIKDELNVLEFEIENKEENFVVYKSTPDNTLVGGNLKKLYNKELKEKLSALTREECLEYIREKKIKINDIEIQEGWLNISKEFNATYKSHPEIGADSNLDASVMIVKKMDDNLFKMRVAREIVNTVQRLRKSAGLNIDDHVEIFFELNKNGDAKSKFEDVFGAHFETMKKSVRVPFIDAGFKQAHMQVIADTKYEFPEDSNDQVRIYICVPNIYFDEAKMQDKFATQIAGNANFLKDVKNALLSLEQSQLKNSLEKTNGVVRFKLSNVPVELVYQQDFYLTSYDRYLKNN